MVVSGLSKFRPVLTWDTANSYQRNAIAQEFRKSNLFRLKRSVRKLYAKCHSQSGALCGSQRELPHWLQVKTSRTALNVAPIAADVEPIHKWEARNLLHMLLKRLPPGSCRQRWAALFPRIAH